MHNWDETTKITGVIFDWSGTILDFGAMAPIRAYMKSFEECGVPVTEDEARNSLELTRYDHIRNMLGTRRISRNGNVPGEKPGIRTMSKRFICLSIKILKRA